MCNFLVEATQLVARPSPGEQPVRGMHQAMLDWLPLCMKNTKTLYLMKQDKVLWKVDKEAPKWAKEKFWRVVVTATTLGDTLVEL